MSARRRHQRQRARTEVELPEGYKAAGDRLHAAFLKWHAENPGVSLNFELPAGVASGKVFLATDLAVLAKFALDERTREAVLYLDAATHHECTAMMLIAVLRVTGCVTPLAVPRGPAN